MLHMDAPCKTMSPLVYTSGQSRLISRAYNHWLLTIQSLSCRANTKFRWKYIYMRAHLLQTAPFPKETPRKSCWWLSKVTNWYWQVCYSRLDISVHKPQHWQCLWHVTIFRGCSMWHSANATYAMPVAWPKWWFFKAPRNSISPCLLDY